MSNWRIFAFFFSYFGNIQLQSFIIKHWNCNWSIFDFYMQLFFFLSSQARAVKRNLLLNRGNNNSFTVRLSWQPLKEQLICRMQNLMQNLSFYGGREKCNANMRQPQKRVGHIALSSAPLDICPITSKFLLGSASELSGSGWP